MEQLAQHSYIVGIIKWLIIVEHNLAIPQKVKLSYHMIQLKTRDSYKILYENVHSSPIYNSQKMETTQTSMNR